MEHVRDQDRDQHRLFLEPIQHLPISRCAGRGSRHAALRPALAPERMGEPGDGNYTEGFSPNKGFVYPGTLSPPSGATSWEAGAKFEFFEGRLRATVDYYDLVKTNVAITDPNFRTYKNGVCAAATCNIIAGEAHSSGPEVDIQGELLPGLNVSVAYTNQDVRISRGTSNSDGLSGFEPGQVFPMFRVISRDYRPPMISKTRA